jgi:thiol-disulfide isomerase/thioredoxin
VSCTGIIRELRASCRYAPWCSHCIKAAPEYKVAAERMDGEVEFGAINCVVRHP